MKAVITKMQNLPYLLLIFATFFWGTNFVFSRIIVEEIPPFQLSVMRWVTASFVFLPFVFKELKQNIGVMKENWRALLLLGVTGIAGFNTLLYIGIQYTNSISASLVNSISPLLIVLLAVFFLKEKLLPIQYIGVIVSFIGVAIVVTGGSLETLLTLTFNKGDLIVFAAVISWSIYSILMKKFGVNLPKRSTFIITMYIGILVLIPFALFERTYQPVSLTSLSIEMIFGVIYLGIFPSIISFICWNEGVMQVGPGKTSNYLHLIVLFTTILAILVGGETLTLTQISGGFFILTGVLVASNPQFMMRLLPQRGSKGN
ncbi:DMT family transporter [Anaerobacillus isosaccharinicus]|uniref:DMT family transporter n=2 Tax=Anaerobacillus isosaccharinicus TaxID=1532552 RepID=A0A7S7RB06_9BACI|nr:DMT family transporter [Anaerobacillus isosaccharinicus]MBA5586315.1 EamA family transporter [Anaerobacillus isosaccharinicus]QOY35435.1 EamA family transporter [Anaerobacillus isosaccharinicus]